MPIYEYQCLNCGNNFEVITFAGQDEEDVKCSECGLSNVKKLLSAGEIRPAGIPKGSGGFQAPSCGGKTAGG